MKPNVSYLGCVMVYYGVSINFTPLVRISSGKPNVGNYAIINQLSLGRNRHHSISRGIITFIYLYDGDGLI